MLAAVVTPPAVERWGARRWIVVSLVAAACVQLFPTSLYTRPAVLVAAFVLGLVSQGVKICVDTLVQVGVDDAFRGRVFSLYDVLFNVAFVAAAVTAAVVLPEDGVSHTLLVVTALAYLATAAAFAGAVRGDPTGRSVLASDPVEAKGGRPVP